MQIEKQDLENIIKETVKATILELGLGKVSFKQDKNAYQKTELLLWNYNSFKRVVKEKQMQIEEYRKYGVPNKGGAVHTYCAGGTVHGMCTVDENVDNAVHNINMSIQELLGAIEMVDNAVAAMKDDSYYPILELRYFNGMSQEDIAKALNCTQPNISYHKNRLVRELSLRLFPNDVINEIVQ